MTQLGSFALMLVILMAVGGLFAFQYKLSTRDKNWGILVLPMVFVILYLAISIGATVKGNQYETKEFSTKDYFGNTLEMTAQVPKEGKAVALFSDLYVYDENHVLLDEIALGYKDNVPYESFSQGYASDITKMMQGLELNGTSVPREDVAGWIMFFEARLGGNPFLVFLLPFGISIVLLIFVGMLTRVIQRRKLRIRSMKKIDIQSFEGFHNM